MFVEGRLCWSEASLVISSKTIFFFLPITSKGSDWLKPSRWSGSWQILWWGVCGIHHNLHSFHAVPSSTKAEMPVYKCLCVLCPSTLHVLCPGTLHVFVSCVWADTNLIIVSMSVLSSAWQVFKNVYRSNSRLLIIAFGP